MTFSSFRTSSGKTIRAAVFALLAVLMVAGLTSECRAQQSTVQPSAQSAPGNFMKPETAKDQNVAAAQEEDETAVYKTSPSVRAIGRMLHLSPHAASVVFEDLNFLILAGVIVFYLAKALPKFFRGRQETIDKHLVEARQATDDANERLRIVEERLGRLDQEINELRSRSEKEGAADEERMKASIEEERRKIVAAAEHEINAMSTAAERSLRNFGAELAIARASGRLHLSDADDRAMIRDFGASLDRRRN